MIAARLVQLKRFQVWLGAQASCLPACEATHVEAGKMPALPAKVVAGAEVWNHCSMQGNPELVSQLFFDPKHVGEAVEPNFTGRAASFKCGASLRISLHIDESQRITEAKFKAAGCSVLVASASLLIDEVVGKTTGEAAALGQRAETLQEKLGDLPAQRNECTALACAALVTAIQSYSDLARDDWEGDEALICTCFCVSERTIEREIQSRQLRTIAEVTAACNAGAGCRSCYPLIEDILEEVNRES